MWEVTHTRSVNGKTVQGKPRKFDTEPEAWQYEVTLWEDPAVKTVRVRKVKNG